MALRLGDARSGKLADNLGGFGRALRRAGVALDSEHIVLATEAALAVGLADRADLESALEAVMVSREQDRMVFRELFDAFFRDPAVANKLLAQMLPSAEGKADPIQRRPRVREALSPQLPPGRAQSPQPSDKEVEFDAAMTASELDRLRHADFNALGASEYQLVQRLACSIRLPLPQVAMRRVRPGLRGARMHWPRTMRSAARTGGELLHLPRMQRERAPLPLLVLVDVSGSMERYARLLLAFLHAATHGLRRRDIFAFGTRLTDLNAAMRMADPDQMLEAVNRVVEDFAGGTRLGASLAQLRLHHGRRLVGRRTLVLVITDGLDTGEPQDLLQELDWLRRHCRRLLWLNPLLRFDGYAPLARGAGALHSRAHAMLAVHNLEKLEDLASSLAKLVRD